ncbi:MAG: ABC transporter substrate-binding protein [Clostridiales bacterium]|jgi:polar amino acid transport system substrate-binding protein|nr:ABC transporter substrate-binding protein [Clostridiales bacterium]
MRRNSMVRNFLNIHKAAAVLFTAVLVPAALSACTGTAVRTLSDIKSKGEIIMLTNATFEPFEYISGGKVAGADVDLAQLVADEIGVQLTVIDMDFDLLVDALKSGKGDFIAAGMTATEERAKSVDFSAVYVSNGLLVIVPADSALTVEDLDGKRTERRLRVAVQEGTTSDDYATDELAGADVMRFKDAVAVGSAVQSGKADAALLDIKPAEGVVANSGGTLKLLPEQVTEEDTCMAVAKGNKELLEVINKVLIQAISEGTVDALIEKHMELTTK